MEETPIEKDLAEDSKEEKAVTEKIEEKVDSAAVVEIEEKEDSVQVLIGQDSKDEKYQENLNAIQ